MPKEFRQDQLEGGTGFVYTCLTCNRIAFTANIYTSVEEIKIRKSEHVCMDKPKPIESQSQPQPQEN